jgi:hypothetical protein
VSGRSFEGPPIDATGQYLTGAPYWTDDGTSETVDVLGNEATGTEAYHNVPTPGSDPTPDTTGQTTLADWGWSA